MYKSYISGSKLCLSFKKSAFSIRLYNLPYAPARQSISCYMLAICQGCDIIWDTIQRSSAFHVNENDSLHVDVLALSSIFDALSRSIKSYY